MEAPLYWNLLAFALLATALSWCGCGRKLCRREIDALRRYAHAM